MSEHTAEIDAPRWTVPGLVVALAARRRALGLRQADIARAIGYGQQLVSRWESGDNAPDLDQLRAYADVVGLELRIDLCVIPPGVGNPAQPPA